VGIGEEIEEIFVCNFLPGHGKSDVDNQFSVLSQVVDGAILMGNGIFDLTTFIVELEKSAKRLELQKKICEEKNFKREKKQNPKESESKIQKGETFRHYITLERDLEIFSVEKNCEQVKIVNEKIEELKKQQKVAKKKVTKKTDYLY